METAPDAGRFAAAAGRRFDDRAKEGLVATRDRGGAVGRLYPPLVARVLTAVG
jgi:hypothetical protein